MIIHVADAERLSEVCQRYGVARLDVFGSVAKGTATASSDVDLLYTLGSETRLGWAIEDLAAELGDVFGRHVDLVSREALNVWLKEGVLADAEPLYAAA